jgi:DNA-binding NarL/FixJ family response regulator
MEERWVLVTDPDARRAQVACAVVATRPGLRAMGVRDSVRGVETALRGGPCDLLVTDLELPGGCVLELLAAARAWSGRLEAIVATGVREAQVVRAPALLGVVDYVLKPAGPARLGQALDRYLACAARSPSTRSTRRRSIARATLIDHERRAVIAVLRPDRNPIAAPAAPGAPRPRSHHGPLRQARPRDGRGLDRRHGLRHRRARARGAHLEPTGPPAARDQRPRAARRRQAARDMVREVPRS